MGSTSVGTPEKDMFKDICSITGEGGSEFNYFKVLKTLYF